MLIEFLSKVMVHTQCDIGLLISMIVYTMFIISVLNAHNEVAAYLSGTNPN